MQVEEHYDLDADLLDSELRASDDDLQGDLLDAEPPAGDNGHHIKFLAMCSKATHLWLMIWQQQSWHYQ